MNIIAKVKIAIKKSLIKRIKNIETLDDMKKLLKFAQSQSKFKPGKKIEVDNKMQTGYSYTLQEPVGKNFDPEFKPDLTPKQMLDMGVFEGKYCNDCVLEYPREWFKDAIKKGKLSPEKANSDINEFNIKSRQSLKIWKKKGWIFGPDPRGWFEWYMRYYLGRRIPDVDKKQIKRWKAFKRHEAQVIKNCRPNDKKCRPKQRQALAQWAYNPNVG